MTQNYHLDPDQMATLNISSYKEYCGKEYTSVYKFFYL